jgi:hypothetical protein
MEAAIILAAVGQRYRFTLDPDAVIGIGYPRHPAAPIRRLPTGCPNLIRATSPLPIHLSR